MPRYVKGEQVIETSHPREGAQLKAAGFVVERERPAAYVAHYTVPDEKPEKTDEK